MRMETTKAVIDSADKTPRYNPPKNLLYSLVSGKAKN